MPDSDFRSQGFAKNVVAVEAALREALGFAPERLDEAAVRSQYPRRRFVKGWRVPTEF